MAHSSPKLPEGHGELLVRPRYEEWAAVVEGNRDEAASWRFEVAGVAAATFREIAREQLLARAREFSARLGVPVRAAGPAGAPLVMTGHQPDLYHPGVWVKDFLIQRLADDTGATAVDVVVDTDGFGAVGVTSPCMRPGVMRCRQYLAVAAPDAAFAGTPVPDPRALADFRRAVGTMLESLPAPSVHRHFARFADCLSSAAGDANDLAELITFARRRYEATAGTDYLEVPVTHFVRDSAFQRFAVHIVLDARSFAELYNEELARYRAQTGTRSVAQPFPDLEVSDAAVELPFWWFEAGRRHAVSASERDGGVTLVAAGRELAWLPGDHDAAIDRIRDLSPHGVLVPKALTLTMFLRLFASDLFVHGVGGGRYDRVTDSVIRRYFGVRAPRYAVTSITLYLPLGAKVVTDEEVAAATERLNRFQHNPDQVISMVDFDDERERERAMALIEEKAALTRAITAAGADKKALGARIRAVNAELAGMLQPARQELAEQLERLRSQRAAADILTDRTYPFCFWDPVEVADKVR